MTRIRSSTAIVFTLLCSLWVLPVLASTAWTDGQDAILVIGQPNFTTNASGISATALQEPGDVALDLRHGKLYVADKRNNRVLRYAYPITASQPAAELVFGQPDFTSIAPGVSSAQMDVPLALAVDPAGRLWVADVNNHRVLRFDQAHLLQNNQPPADAVLGQADFVSNATAATTTGMHRPFGLVVDGDDTLFVGDSANNRVLRFDNASTKPNGAPADGVLGQPDFTSSGAGTTQTGMQEPRGVAVDPAGTLWVADRSNLRVLRFDNASAKPNGAAADGVLGQPDFTSNASMITQTGMDYPGKVVTDERGRLYVSDGFAPDRVLIYDDATSKPNGGAADNVLGQPDFTSGGPGVGANRLSLDSGGGGMAIDTQRDLLIIADTNNHRVMIFQASTTLAANPVPVITAITPAQAVRGGSEFVLTVDGNSFVDGASVVRWNGVDLVTRFESASKLTAVVPANLIATTGSNEVTVFTSEPGGGTSNTVVLEVISVVYLPFVAKSTE